MGKFSTKSVAIYDLGIFGGVAETLAKEFGKTFYYSPWESPYPRENAMLICADVPGVTRLNKFWDCVPETDLFVFPDVCTSSEQIHLEEYGELLNKVTGKPKKRIWGSRNGDELELLRDITKEHLRALGLPVSHYATRDGMKALREYLKSHPDVWVKVNITRGDMESFHSPNYQEIEPRLDEVEYSLGMKKLTKKFIIEDAINDSHDLAFDGYSVDGKFPKKAMIGLEVKGSAYVGVMKDEKDYPEQIKEFNKKISSTLKNYRYRSFFSPEMRIAKDKKGYMDDACCRCGSPPNELMLMQYTNLAEIIWEGAAGNCIDPIPAGEFGIELIIHSSWAERNWQPVQFPAEIADHVKLRCHTVIQGKHYVIPQQGGPITVTGSVPIGALVATGKTFKETYKKIETYAPMIKGHGITADAKDVLEAIDEIKELELVGIKL